MKNISIFFYKQGIFFFLFFYEHINRSFSNHYCKKQVFKFFDSTIKPQGSITIDKIYPFANWISINLDCESAPRIHKQLEDQIKLKELYLLSFLKSSGKKLTML